MTDDEIGCSELKELLDQQHEVVILDVREQDEYNISNLENSLLIPLNNLSSQLDHLNKDDDYVVLCRSGMRSAHAVAMMKDYGFKNVRNLVGGINQWAQDIDQSLTIY